MKRSSNEKTANLKPVRPSCYRLRRLFSLICIFAMIYLFVRGFMAPLHLADADIGRHIKNGELVVTQGIFPTTNYYSYTEADFPVINHHWASGVLFYLLYHQGGFSLLSWSYVVILLGSALILFLLTARSSGVGCASLAFLALWPLITFRLEIRPEGFSYLLCALFSYILWQVVIRRRPRRWLILLPILTALWVNLHIYFIMGLFILGVYMGVALCEFIVLKAWDTHPVVKRRIMPLLHSADAATAGRTASTLVFTFIACALATLLNPNGFMGALEPFFIFKDYGYLLVENQSIWFLRKVLPLPQLDLYEQMAILLLMMTIFALYRAFRRSQRIDIALHLIALTFTVMAALALRNFTLMGLYTAPILASNLRLIVPVQGARARKKGNLLSYLMAWVPLTAALSCLLIVVMNNGNLWQKRWENSNISVVAGGPGAIEFYLREGLHGPIFNNYDIGGLLIMGLFPKEQVFVDNRPEAYPAAFFREQYIPMQEDDQKWQEAMKRFGFQTIFFGYRDLTPWGQTFLSKRLNDPAWVPVFADLSALIFVPNDEAHRAVISKYRLPPDMFTAKRRG